MSHFRGLNVVRNGNAADRERLELLMRAFVGI